MAEEDALELVQPRIGGKLSYAVGQSQPPAPETSSDQPSMSLLRSEGDPGEFYFRITSHASSDQEEALSGEEMGTRRTAHMKSTSAPSISHLEMDFCSRGAMLVHLGADLPSEIVSVASSHRELKTMAACPIPYLESGSRDLSSEASSDQELSNPLLDAGEEEFSRHIVEIAGDMKEKFPSQLKKVQFQTKMIYRVPQYPRCLDEDAYTPQFVSFGPYHHGTKALRSADKYKWSFLHQILNMYKDKDKALKMYLKEMDGLMQEVKGHYEEDIQDDEIKMLLLDGCCILGFLGIIPLPQKQIGATTVRKYIPRVNNKLPRTFKVMAASPLPSSILPQQEVGDQTHREQDKVVAEASTVQKNLSGDNKMPEDMFETMASSGLAFDAREKEIGIALKGESKRTADSAIITLWHHDSIRHDLLLVENQLPFFVLQKIYDLATAGTAESLTLKDEVDRTIQELLKSYPLITTKQSFHHLLHCCHLKFKPAMANGSSSDSKPLHCCRLKFKPAMANSSSSDSKPTDDLKQKWRGATDLYKAGIKFKPKLPDPNSTEFSLLDVQLVSGRTLMIPTLKIEDSTRSVFRNLIAFEQSCTRENYFAAYAFFMGELMGAPEDVTLLVNQKVVENYIGANKEVSDFFNNLVKGVIFDVNGEHFLRSTFKDLNSYYNSAGHKYFADLKQNYCGSPWLVISMVVAAVILVCTVVQTVFAVMK